MKTIVGLFQNYTDANEAITRLHESGYTKEQISLMARENAIKDKVEGATVDMAIGTQGGARAGAVVGGLTGLLAGITALVIPGIGPILTIGTLASAIGSTAVGAGIGAAAGGVVGALAGLGLPQEEANYYAEGVQRGGILVAVNTEEGQEDAVRNLFDECNVVNVQSQHREGWKAFDANANYQTL